MIDVRKSPDSITEAMVSRYGASEDKQSLKKISRLYKQTLLDGSFQRWGGIEHGSGWSVEDGISYVRNVLSGSVFNKIILAHVPSCLEYALKINDAESIVYFTEKKEEGIEYVSIDGNNSSSMINAFLENHDEMYFTGSGGSKKYFKDFTEDERESIQHDKTLTVTILTKITLSEMTELFRAMNKQTNLNNQEHRQARITPLSQFIRELANENNQDKKD
jgi:hypothetical protein